MQSLQYDITGSQTIAVWPDTPASSSASDFRMELSNDYDKSTTTVDLTLINVPTSITPRLVFSLNKAELPSYTGNYTISIKEGVITGKPLIWGQTDRTWSQIDAKWSDSIYEGGSDFVSIDTDRAWVSGSDVPSFTQYSSPDENGAYYTYHG